VDAKLKCTMLAYNHTTVDWTCLLETSVKMDSVVVHEKITLI
jgi:hypothetical protein